jgi:hypothetical protein
VPHPLSIGICGVLHKTGSLRAARTFLTLVIVPPATIVAVANIRPTGSSAIYNSRLCKSQPAPA